MNEVRLTESELERYSRQISLDYIGYEGQLHLRNGRVCVVGVGGLGSPAALKMAAMGVGYLRIIDRDVVSKSDLHRQNLYDESSIGFPKVEVAARKLNSLNSEVKIDALATSITFQNVEKLVEGVDVIIDGLDSVEARYAVNRACLNLNIPYIYAGAIETYGNISTIIPGETACLECFFPKVKDNEIPRCAVVGVFPPVIDVVSNIEVSEAVRIILGKEACLKNRLLFVDLRQLVFNTINIIKNPDCSVCGKGSQQPTVLENRAVSGICGRDGRGTFIINSNVQSLDIKKISHKARENGLIINLIANMGLTFEYDKKVRVSVLNGGVIIIQVAPGSGIRDEEAVLKLYREIADLLDLPNV